MFKSLCILFLFPLFAFCQVNKDGDFQFWQMFSVQKHLTKPIRLRFETEVRFGDDLSNFYFTYMQGQLVYDANYLIVSPGYRQSFIKRRSNWETTYSPLVDIYLTKEFNKLKLVDRTRIQYLINDNSGYLFRNRPRIAYSFKHFWLFVDNEFFFRENRGYSQNRFSTGILAHFQKHLSGKFFYMLRQQKFDTWHHHHILGIYLYLIF